MTKPNHWILGRAFDFSGVLVAGARLIGGSVSGAGPDATLRFYGAAGVSYDTPARLFWAALREGVIDENA